ncbi:MFS general substrate transporter [Serendipita vermifera]|nr:MFS general substrate transporter [Serendipita vermifera]
MSDHVSPQKPPFALKFRSSVGFVTAVVLLSIFVDLFVYALIIPVIPFRLEELGYKSPAALTGWLMFAFSFGLIVATPPLAYFSERYWSRRAPLIVAILLLVGSQAMFMEARVYWLMVLARVIQGVSSATVWVVSFALLCDTVPENKLPRQLGIVMSGLTLGFLIGPPIGGVMNEKLGYRSPFILSMGVCVLDLAGRLFVIEREVASKWAREMSADEGSQDTTPNETRERSQLSPLRVVIKLGRSKRAFIALVNTFIYGIILTMLEPTLPLRLQALYGYTSLKVGIIYLTAAVPSLISTPLAGFLIEKLGLEWIVVLSLTCSIPFWVLIGIKGSVAFLVTSLAFAFFFLGAVTTPITVDLAEAAREVEGLGYAHTFGAFNLAYSISSAIGPVIGGQLYSHVKQGWEVITYLSTGLIVLATLAAFYGAGSRPLLDRVIGTVLKEKSNENPGEVEKGPQPAESRERPASVHSQRQESIREVVVNEKGTQEGTASTEK